MKFRTSTIVRGLLATTGLLVGASALATPITADDRWYEFTFDGATNAAPGCMVHSCLFDIHPQFLLAGASPWTFRGPAVFSVTDFGHRGDHIKTIFPTESGGPVFFRLAAVPASVIEPASLTLFGLGLGGIALMRRARRKDSKQSVAP